MENKISIINVYIHNFLLASNKMAILEALRRLLAKKYEIKG